jgi:hypothetical protein
MEATADATQDRGLRSNIRDRAGRVLVAPRDADAVADSLSEINHRPSIPHAHAAPDACPTTN